MNSVRVKNKPQQTVKELAHRKDKEIFPEIHRYWAARYTFYPSHLSCSLHKLSEYCHPRLNAFQMLPHSKPILAGGWRCRIHLITERPLADCGYKRRWILRSLNSRSMGRTGTKPGCVAFLRCRPIPALRECPEADRKLSIMIFLLTRPSSTGGFFIIQQLADFVQNWRYVQLIHNQYVN